MGSSPTWRTKTIGTMGRVAPGFVGRAGSRLASKARPKPISRGVIPLPRQLFRTVVQRHNEVGFGNWPTAPCEPRTNPVRARRGNIGPTGP